MRRSICISPVSIGCEIAEARQRGAIGAHEEDRLDQVAARLHDGERREFLVVERALAHGAVDREAELLDDLVEPQRRHAAVAAAAVGEQRVGIGDGGLAALDGDIHLSPPMMRVVRGRPITCPSRHEQQVDAAREQRAVVRPLRDEVGRQAASARSCACP